MCNRVRNRENHLEGLITKGAKVRVGENLRGKVPEYYIKPYKGLCRTRSNVDDLPLDKISTNESD